MSLQKWECKSVIFTQIWNILSKNTLSPEKPANSSNLSIRAGNSERVCVTIRKTTTTQLIIWCLFIRNTDAIFQMNIPSWKHLSQKRLRPLNACGLVLWKLCLTGRMRATPCMRIMTLSTADRFTQQFNSRVWQRTNWNQRQVISIGLKGAGVLIAPIMLIYGQWKHRFPSLTCIWGSCSVLWFLL